MQSFNINKKLLRDVTINRLIARIAESAPVENRRSTFIYDNIMMILLS